MLKFIGAAIPFLFFHLLCCGALLFFLVSTGYLLLLSNEGKSKIFLIPVLLLGALFLWLHHRHGKCCEEKGYQTFGDRALGIILYMVFSFIIGIAFMIYVFIPWWIPNYNGGIILP